MRCGADMVALQTLLALYRFEDSTALPQLVNPLMWIGLGLFFVTGWIVGWVVERLPRLIGVVWTRHGCRAGRVPSGSGRAFCRGHATRRLTRERPRRGGGKRVGSASARPP